MTYSNANKAPFNTGSNFCREGQFVLGTYHGNEFAGTVVSSRVKYGGKIQHQVELIFSWDIKDTILVTEDELEGAFEIMKIEKHQST